jgi:hypothetical protein
MTHVAETPRVATVHDMVKESGRVLPRPSVIFHTYASTDTPWVARTLSHYTPVKRGRVLSNLAPHDATQFAGPHESYMRQYTTQNLLIRTQPTRALIDLDGGYHLGAPKFISNRSPSFQSSIHRFPLIASPGLPLCQHGNHLNKSM